MQFYPALSFESTDSKESAEIRTMAANPCLLVMAIASNSTFVLL